jgi:predicted ribosomally synthesized peptide with nif11-like leader
VRQFAIPGLTARRREPNCLTHQQKKGKKMSVEQAKAFIEKLGSDENLLNQVNSAENDGARMQLAKAAGFDFSTDEFNSVVDQLSGEELTEDDLDSVAGGLTAQIDGLKVSKWKMSRLSWFDKSSPDLL